VRRIISPNSKPSFKVKTSELAEMLEKVLAYNVSQIIRARRKKLSEPQEMEWAAA
jgi:hypothetical protein